MDVGHPATSMAAMRSYRRDPRSPSVAPKGTVRRVLGIARPYRRDLIWFLLVVGSSLIGVVTPLLAGDIVNRIARLEGTTGGIVRIALFIAGLAVVDAHDISLATGGTPRGSARASSTTCAPASSSTCSGCRSRSSPARRRVPWSVAQQRRHRRPARVHLDAVRGRLQRDRPGAHRRRDARTVLADHPAVAGHGAAVRAAGPADRAAAAGDHPESYELNASMNATMTERFNVAGALLVKLFGPSAEAESFRGRAARVRDIGVLSAMYGRTFFTALTLVAALATALVYGLGGWLAFTARSAPVTSSRSRSCCPASTGR